jgi:hypothetical protein
VDSNPLSPGSVNKRCDEIEEFDEVDRSTTLPPLKSHCLLTHSSKNVNIFWNGIFLSCPEGLYLTQHIIYIAMHTYINVKKNTYIWVGSWKGLENINPVVINTQCHCADSHLWTSPHFK